MLGFMSFIALTPLKREFSLSLVHSIEADNKSQISVMNESVVSVSYALRISYNTRIYLEIN